MSGLSLSNLHSHRCGHCGIVWRHDPSTIPEGKNVEAHQCTGCGMVQYMKHREMRFGERVPAEFCNNGARTLPVPAGDHHNVAAVDDGLVQVLPGSVALHDDMEW